MNNYELGLKNADLSYGLYDILIDYNSVLPTTGNSFTTIKDEFHIYSSIQTSYYTTFDGYSNIKKSVYDSYDAADLRKSLFFRVRSDNGIDFRGSYSSSFLFGATAVDEMLLIRAECKARLNNVAGSMDDLNTLLVKRYKSGTFVPRSAASAQDALKIILNERRKELIRRGIRWSDLKRLNKEPQFAQTLTRVLDGKTYSLPPNDPRYIMPIPLYVIDFNKIQQNVR